MTMTPGKFRTRYIYKLLCLVQEQGYEVSNFYESINLTPKLIREQVETSRQQYEKIHFDIIDQVDIPGLGMVVGSKINLTELSLAGLAFMFSSVLEKGIKRWIKFQELSDPPFRYEFHLGSEQSLIRATPHLTPFQETLQRTRFAIEESMAEFNAIGEMFDRPYGWFDEIHLSYPEPGYSELYEKYFHCPVKFNQPYNQFLFSSNLLKRPMRIGDEDIAQILEFKCAVLIKSTRVQDELVYTIQSILMSDPEKYKSISDVANALNVSERTLRRRLTTLGTTFKDISFNYRMNLATEYLLSTDLPISAISVMVGYSDTANFFRAFRRHSDMTPDEYRHQSENHPENNPTIS